ALDAEMGTDLAQLGVAYLASEDPTTGQGPASVAEVRTSIAGRLFQQITRGEVVVYWKVKVGPMPPNASETILACEKRITQSESMVLMADCKSVKRMTKDEFAKAPKAGK